MALEKELSFEERKKAWLEISAIDEAEFDAKWKFQTERQSKVPQPGWKAPDFELDLLDRRGKAKGQTITLESLRGKPVALFFCSYT